MSESGANQKFVSNDEKAYLDVQRQNEENNSRSTTDTKPLSEQAPCKNERYVSHILPDILQQVGQEQPQNNILNPTTNQTNLREPDANTQKYFTPGPPPKPSRTFATSSHLSQNKDSCVNNNVEFDIKNQNHNNSSSSHELYLSCLDNTSGEADTRPNNHNSSTSSSNKDTEQNCNTNFSNDTNNFCTPSMDNTVPIISSAIVSNLIEGSPLATSSPKETSVPSDNFTQSNHPPAVPIRRSSFTSAISGQDHNKKADSVKLTEDEMTKIYQERNPLERLAKLNSLKTKDSNLVADIILARYLY